MDENDLSELLREALEKWGYATQMLIWVEEMAELTKELVKRDRIVCGSSDEKIAEELADVDLCLDQMKMLYPKYKQYKAQKVQRLRRLVLLG